MSINNKNNNRLIITYRRRILRKFTLGPTKRRVQFYIEQRYGVFRLGG